MFVSFLLFDEQGRDLVHLPGPWSVVATCEHERCQLGIVRYAKDGKQTDEKNFGAICH